MKYKSNIKVCIAALLAAIPLASQATVFFNDTFGSGSTLNSLTPAAPTASSTAYQLSSSKPLTPAPTIGSGDFKFGIASTSGGGAELQALFTTTPVALVLNGDYIRLTVTFTNTSGIQTTNCLLGFGLYDGNQVAPHAGGLNNTALDSSSDKATGGVQGWKGYWGQRAFTGVNSRIVLRQPQTGANNRNQNLTSTGSGTQSYGFPSGSTIGGQGNTQSGPLVTGNTYTVVLTIQLVGANTVAVTNTYYNGADTNGTVVAQFGEVASGANYVTSSFDGIGIGWRGTAHAAVNMTMDISSITVDGSVTVVSAPPDIITQPVAVTVPSGGSCAFNVVADGFGMTYQWKRYGTNLPNGGNISGATSDTLIISPASAADVASGANAYFVTVTGTGGFTTNSATADLALGTAKDLVWSGSGNVWDLNTSTNWIDPVNPAAFNYGDSVTFGDAGAVNGAVTLTGKYLSALSVTVDTSAPGFDYTFVGVSTGGFAGPGQLIYKGAGLLFMNNINTYTGGTIISNASAYMVVGNYNALGSGPVTLAKAGGLMEVVPTGSAAIGFTGNFVVEDDFTFQFDGTGAFAGVYFGNFSGTSSKTLTLNQLSPTSTNRYRFYGTSTVMDANILVNGNSTTYAPANGTVISPYNGTGSQVYNGVISGNGGILQRGGGTTILNAQNTYAGGTIPTTGTIGIGADSIPTTGTVTSGPLGTGALIIANDIGTGAGSGTVLAFGGARTIANPLAYPGTTNTHQLIIGGTNALTFTGAFDLNGMDGSTTQTNRIVQVNNTALTTLQGVISGAGNLIKTGTGVLDLTGVNTYTGNTAVSNGTLRVNGSLNAASAVTVASGGSLGGSGTVGGSVAVLAGGSLAPGTSIGTLNIGGNLTHSGNLAIEVNRSGSSSDQVNVTGTRTNAGTGTVNVSNLGAALQAGDTFTLFNGPLLNGNALTVTGSSAVWTNKLAVNGTISVVTPISTTPTNISYSLSGNSLTLSWPLSHLTWSLQSNIVGVASSASWFTVPGSANNNQIVITVNPARSNVFYRMVYP